MALTLNALRGALLDGKIAGEDIVLRAPRFDWSRYVIMCDWCHRDAVVMYVFGGTNPLTKTPCVSLCWRCLPHQRAALAYSNYRPVSLEDFTTGTGEACIVPLLRPKDEERP